METRVLIQSAPKPYEAFPHPSDATHKIWSRLANWLQRYSSLKVWTTDDGPLLYYKLTLWAEGSGELKMLQLRGIEFHSIRKAFTKSSNQINYICSLGKNICNDLDRVKRIWYLSPMRAAKVQASLRIRAVSPEPSLLAHTSSESRGTFRQKARSLAPLNGWACAVKICHDGMLEDTNSLDGAHLDFHTGLNHIRNTFIFTQNNTIG